MVEHIVLLRLLTYSLTDIEDDRWTMTVDGAGGGSSDSSTNSSSDSNSTTGTGIGSLADTNERESNFWKTAEERFMPAIKENVDGYDNLV